MTQKKYRCNPKKAPQWCRIVTCDVCPAGELVKDVEDIPEDTQKVVDEHFDEML